MKEIEPRVQFNISVPKAIRSLAFELAAERGEPVRDLVARLIREAAEQRGLQVESA